MFIPTCNCVAASNEWSSNGIAAIPASIDASSRSAA